MFNVQDHLEYCDSLTKSVLMGPGGIQQVTLAFIWACCRNWHTRSDLVGSCGSVVSHVHMQALRLFLESRRNQFQKANGVNLIETAKTRATDTHAHIEACERQLATVQEIDEAEHAAEQDAVAKHDNEKQQKEARVREDAVRIAIVSSLVAVPHNLQALVFTSYSKVPSFMSFNNWCDICGDIVGTS